MTPIQRRGTVFGAAATVAVAAAVWALFNSPHETKDPVTTDVTGGNRIHQQSKPQHFTPPSSKQQSRLNDLSSRDRRSEVLAHISLWGRETRPETWGQGCLELIAYAKANPTMLADLAWGTYRSALNQLDADELLNVIKANSSKIFAASEGVSLTTGIRPDADLVALLCDKFGSQNREEELMEKILSDSITSDLRNAVCASILGSRVASNYPAGLEDIGSLPFEVRRSVEQRILEDLTGGDRMSALEFTLNRAQSISVTDVCMQHFFNDAWFRENADAASAMIRDASPSPRRDFAIGEMVRAIAKTSPYEANKWVAAIEDSTMRARALTFLAETNQK